MTIPEAVADTTGEAPQEPVSKRTVFAIVIMVFGTTAATLMPALVALPIIVARVAPQNKESGLGTALGILAFGGMVLAPLFGALSDRTTSRLGMRKPFLIIGSALVILGLVVLGLANSLGAVYAAVALLTLGGGVGSASQALIPDSIPEHARGRVMGLATVMGVVAGLIASVIGPRFIDHQFVMAVVAVPLYVVTLLIGLPLYRDRVLDRKDVPQQAIVRTVLHSYRFNPKSAPDFAWVWLGRLLITFGIAFTSSFAIYFLTDELKVGPAELASLISLNSVLGLAGTTVGTIIGAVLTDKVRSRKSLVLVSALLLAAGGVIAAFSSSVPVFLVGSVLVYTAVGLFIPTDGVLVMSVLPGGGHDVAKYMSIITIADQLPRAVGPMLAPAIIALGALTPLGGYPVLYLAAGVVAIAGGVLVRRVRSVS